MAGLLAHLRQTIPRNRGGEMSLIETNGVQGAYLVHQRVYGEEHEHRVADQLIEEMGELTTALMQHRRGRNDVSTQEILEETIDVVLCLDFLLRDLGVANFEAKHLATTLATQLDAKLSAAERRGEPMEAIRAKL